MQRKEIEKTYIKKINKLKKYNKAYFELDNPLISDRDYDHIKKEILVYTNLMSNEPELIKVNNNDNSENSNSEKFTIYDKKILLSLLIPLNRSSLVKYSILPSLIIATLLSCIGDIPNILIPLSILLHTYLFHISQYLLHPKPSL